MDYTITNWETKDGRAYVRIEARIGMKAVFKESEPILESRPTVVVEHYFAAAELKDRMTLLDKVHELIAELEIQYDAAVADNSLPDLAEMLPYINTKAVADKKRALTEKLKP